MKLTNPSQQAVSVDIVNAQGAHDGITVQPKATVTLANGWEVSKTWIVNNPSKLVYTPSSTGKKEV